MGITEAWSKFTGEFLQAFRSSNPSSTTFHLDHNDPTSCKPKMMELKLDDKMVSALITLFGMENNGRIKKENGRKLVENLGLHMGLRRKSPLALNLKMRMMIVIMKWLWKKCGEHVKEKRCHDLN